VLYPCRGAISAIQTLKFLTQNFKTMPRYAKKAGDKVEKAMHEMHEGKLKSGRSGKKVTSRKQAIAIGLSEAREEGAKVPKKAAAKKKAPKKAAAKKTTKKAAAKKAAPKKKAAKKTAAKKAAPKKKSPAKKAAAKKAAPKKAARKKSPAKKAAAKKPGRKKS
jgi:hypothetical protein